MYYLELIKRFWDFNRENNVGSTAVAFYLYLLKEGYENERYDFNLSDVKVSHELRLTRKTVKIVKEKLQVLGLIEFQTNNGIPCAYRILLNYPLKPVYDLVKGGLNKNLNDVDVPKLDNSCFSDVEHNNEIIDLQDNTKKEANLSIPTPQRDFKDLIIPNFREVLQYVQTLDLYDITLDTVVKEKYDSWLNAGWINHSKRPITNWKSSIKSALPFLKDQAVLSGLSVQSVPTIKRPKSS